MASITIHLAAANEYLKHHPEENRDDFLAGTIAPDYVPESMVTHHSKKNMRDNARTFIEGKIVLADCLSDFDINTPYGRGYFLHLLLDDEFYKLLKEDSADYIDLSYRDYKDIIYADYNKVNHYFKTKYDVVFFGKTKEYDIDEPGTPLLININTLSKVIEKLSKLDLKKTFTEISRA